MTRARAAAAFTALACLALPACYSYSPLTISVRERATQAPVAGAMVRVTNTSLLNPVKPDAAEGATDANGEVRMRVASYNRLLIRVSIDGRADTLLNADLPGEFGESGWFSTPVDESGQRSTIEVRVAP